MQDVFGWTVPVESIPLPSGGVLYPKNSPLFGKELLQIKAMTAQEEDILMSRALLREGTVITHLIKSCLIDKTIDPSELLLGDRNSLIVAIRITGYGSEYKSNATCGACGKTDTYQFDLTNIELKRLTYAPVSPGSNEFEFVLPVSGKRVTFRLLTGKDEEESLKIRERMQKLFPDAKVDNDVTRVLEMQIVSIDGTRDKAPISAFIKAMPARDSRELRTYMSKVEPGLDMRADITCKSCGAESKVAIPVGASFFWPE